MPDDPLRTAADLASAFLHAIDEPSVFPTVSVAELRSALSGPLPESVTDASEVLTKIATGATPGLVRSQGGR